MRHARPRDRAGITLSEILIAIMIMGVGLISLATLFPVGLDRIRRAQRDVRSAQLVRSALADVESRNLFGQDAYRVNPWVTPAGRDPWITDFFTGMTAANPAVYRGTGIFFDPVTGAPLNPYVPGEGLPVVLDPLWWAQVNDLTKNDATPVDPLSAPADSRFGRGPTLRPDPDGAAASAHGLQRLTTIEFLHPIAALRSQSLTHAANVFSSPDDPVLQAEGALLSETGVETIGATTYDVTDWISGSPVLPTLRQYRDPATKSVVATQSMNDWAFTWIFTGRRSSVNSNTYLGDLVIFHNRPFGLDPAGPSGERVVEAVFGYGTTLSIPTNPAGTQGYSPQSRTVLLRWPTSEPDPDVRTGGWIADVTYELVHARNNSRYLSTNPATPRLYSGQRCHWYRVVRRSDAEPDPQVANYRRMTVTTETPVQSKTEIYDTTGEPVHLNAALVSPYVVYVFPKVFTAR